MTFANPSNYTSMAEILGYVNTVTGGLAIPLLFTLVPAIIIFVVSLPYGLSVALIMGLFFSTIISVFLNVVTVSGVPIVTNQLVLIYAVLTAAAIIGSLVLKNKGGGLLG